MSEKIPADHGEQGRTRSESPPPLDEKEGLRTVDAGLSADQVVAEYDEAETRRIMRKIDYRLIPLLAVLYLYVNPLAPLWNMLTAFDRLAYIDRSNLGNAKIAGMEEDLNLINMRYNTALTVFFVPYALLEVPSNVSYIQTLCCRFSDKARLYSRCCGPVSGFPSYASPGAWSW